MVQPSEMSAARPFRLATLRIDPGLLEIAGPGGVHRVEPKVMAVLCCLARSPGETVSKDRLVAECWDGAFVSDDVVWRSVSRLRRALADDPEDPRLLATIAKRGYRLLVSPEPLAEGAASPADRLETSRGPALSPGSRSRGVRTAWIGAVALAGLAAAALLLASQRSPASIRALPRIAVLPLEGGWDARGTALAGLAGEVVSALTCTARELTVLSERAASGVRSEEPLSATAGRLSADYLLIGRLYVQSGLWSARWSLVSGRDAAEAWAGASPPQPVDELAAVRRVAAGVARDVTLVLGGHLLQPEGAGICPLNQVEEAERSAIGATSAAPRATDRP